ncbi:MAG: PIN domain-containing protein [Deltaproteobacteria bacterium]|nr:PIN domain-containing protein [Deltaproteobacteria bacterium]
MSVLVDTSVWIEYFRSGDHAEKLEHLIDENLIVINDLILAELVPSLKVRNQRKLIELLRSISKLMLSIDWDQIIEFQFKCLRNGLNGIGIPDLILAQNAKQHRCKIYSLDNHFELMRDILKLKLLV